MDRYWKHATMQSPFPPMWAPFKSLFKVSPNNVVSFTRAPVSLSNSVNTNLLRVETYVLAKE